LKCIHTNAGGEYLRKFEFIVERNWLDIRCLRIWMILLRGWVKHWLKVLNVCCHGQSFQIILGRSIEHSCTYLEPFTLCVLAIWSYKDVKDDLVR
jgi:hypothetical protein